MIKSDNEITIICTTCGKPALLREVNVGDGVLTRKISYETHNESIIDPEHIAALTRAESFYKSVFEIIEKYKKLPDKNKIVKIENPAAAGILIELEFGNHRPSACQIRTKVTPLITLKTFSKEYELNLEPRLLAEIDINELIVEASKIAKSYIEEARDRNLLGLG